MAQAQVYPSWSGCNRGQHPCKMVPVCPGFNGTIHDSGPSAVETPNTGAIVKTHDLVH